VSTNIPSDRSVIKNPLSINNRSETTASPRATNVEFVDYNALDVFR
jgi:hypothetical protein